MVHNQSLRSYIIYSIIRVIGLFLSVTSVSFILLLNLPGDPIDLLILEYGKLSQPMIEYLNGYYSDSHHWWTHLTSWMKIVFSDSRLMSKLYHKPVFELIFEHIANTFFLMFTAMFCSACLAFLVVFISYFYKLRFLKFILIHMSYIVIATPLFVLCFFGIYIFSITLNIAPSFIHYNIFTGYNSAFLESYILPFILLLISGFGSFYRYLDVFVRDEMPKNYVLVGRAKGLSRYRLYVHHILKNIFVSFLHVFNIRYIQLFSGAVVIESIFNYPGIGSLTYEAIMSNDYYLAVAIIATISLFILLMNFMIDLAHYWLDPRVLRYK